MTKKWDPPNISMRMGSTPTVQRKSTDSIMLRIWVPMVRALLIGAMIVLMVLGLPVFRFTLNLAMEYGIESLTTIFSFAVGLGMEVVGIFGLLAIFLAWREDWAWLQVAREQVQAPALTLRAMADIAPEAEVAGDTGWADPWIVVRNLNGEIKQVKPPPSIADEMIRQGWAAAAPALGGGSEAADEVELEEEPPRSFLEGFADWLLGRRPVAVQGDGGRGLAPVDPLHPPAPPIYRTTPDRSVNLNVSRSMSPSPGPAAGWPAAGPTQQAAYAAPAGALAPSMPPFELDPADCKLDPPPVKPKRGKARRRGEALAQRGEVHPARLRRFLALLCEEPKLAVHHNLGMGAWADVGYRRLEWRAIMSILVANQLARRKDNRKSSEFELLVSDKAVLEERLRIYLQERG